MNPIDNIQNKSTEVLNLKDRRPMAKGQAIPHEKEARDLALKKTSRDLEATFLTFLVKSMEKTVPKGGLTESKNSLSSMMFSSVMAESMAKQGGIGIAEMIYRSLSNGSELPRSTSSLEELSDYQLNALSSSLLTEDE